MLFSEIDHHNQYDINIFSGNNIEQINFDLMSNLFHPSTIDSSYTHNGKGVCFGIKKLDDSTGKYVWNIKPHSDRIINIDEHALKTIHQIFDSVGDYRTTKLISIHSVSLLNVIKKLAEYPKKVSDIKNIITPCLRN